MIVITRMQLMGIVLAGGMMLLGSLPVAGQEVLARGEEGRTVTVRIIDEGFEHSALNMILRNLPEMYVKSMSFKEGHLTSIGLHTAKGLFSIDDSGRLMLTSVSELTVTEDNLLVELSRWKPAGPLDDVPKAAEVMTERFSVSPSGELSLRGLKGVSVTGETITLDLGRVWEDIVAPSDGDGEGNDCHVVIRFHPEGGATITCEGGCPPEQFMFCGLVSAKSDEDKRDKKDAPGPDPAPGTDPKEKEYTDEDDNSKTGSDKTLTLRCGCTLLGEMK